VTRRVPHGPAGPDRQIDRVQEEDEEIDLVQVLGLMATSRERSSWQMRLAVVRES